MPSVRSTSLMMDILERDFGIVGVVKRWFKSYLGERQQRVMIKQHMSDCFQLNSGQLRRN